MFLSLLSPSPYLSSHALSRSVFLSISHFLPPFSLFSLYPSISLFSLHLHPSLSFLLPKHALYLSLSSLSRLSPSLSLSLFLSLLSLRPSLSLSSPSIPLSLFSLNPYLSLSLSYPSILIRLSSPSIPLFPSQYPSPSLFFLAQSRYVILSFFSLNLSLSPSHSFCLPPLSIFSLHPHPSLFSLNPSLSPLSLSLCLFLSLLPPSLSLSSPSIPFFPSLYLSILIFLSLFSCPITLRNSLFLLSQSLSFSISFFFPPPRSLSLLPPILPSLSLMLPSSSLFLFSLAQSRSVFLSFTPLSLPTPLSLFSLHPFLFLLHQSHSFSLNLTLSLSLSLYHERKVVYRSTLYYFDLRIENLVRQGKETARSRTKQLGMFTADRENPRK
ncbi:hypothetical protein EGW08_021762 [Elysia chlorotica]|uniref:Uncharacterized protein n=1 Tax=Elysia chlorotica TaxID=188477 RepID=A0A433SMR9_ELYCH|nr:hypothetical protein EGW08_021762 [Elysia chlorotica]